MFKPQELESKFLALFRNQAEEAINNRVMAIGTIALANSFNAYLEMEKIKGDFKIKGKIYLYSYIDNIDKMLETFKDDTNVNKKLFTLKTNLLNEALKVLPKKLKTAFENRKVPTCTIQDSMACSEIEPENTLLCNTNILLCADLNNYTGKYRMLDSLYVHFMDLNEPKEDYQYVAFHNVTHCHVILIKNHTKNQLICDHVAFANVFQEDCYSELTSLPKEYSIEKDDIIETIVIDHTGFFNLSLFQRNYDNNENIKFISNDTLIPPMNHFLLGGPFSTNYKHKIVYSVNDNKILLYADDSARSMSYSNVFNKKEAMSIKQQAMSKTI